LLINGSLSSRTLNEWVGVLGTLSNLGFIAAMFA
jgi:hypothetical protein